MYFRSVYFEKQNDNEYNEDQRFTCPDKKVDETEKEIESFEWIDIYEKKNKSPNGVGIFQFDVPNIFF